jgi:tetratricopeptide (TPR) repeat protein
MNTDEASRLYRTARERMDDGDYSSAVLQFEASAVLNPHFKTLELLGECRIHLGLLREAIVPLAAATALNEQSRAPSLLADIFCRLGEMEDASRMARLAIERSPNNRLAQDVLRRVEHASARHG